MTRRYKFSGGSWSGADVAFGCLAVTTFIAAVALIQAWALWALWNWLVPSLFSGPTITFWQAFGICALLSIIGNFFRSRSGGKS